MSELSNNEIRRLDLTLLLVFLGLLKHRKAATVASEIGVTQSAISQALKRLREIFGDELFLRLPHGMEPTATALALEAPISHAVETLRGALGAVADFDPAQAQGVVRVAALDAEQAVLIPALSERLQTQSPRLRLSVLPLGRQAATEALIEGKADLALGFLWDQPDVMLQEKLYDEDYRVVGCPTVLKDAPLLDLDTYCAVDHVLVSPAGDLRGVADETLESMGRSRRVVLALPAFLPVFSAISCSRAIATLPTRLAEVIAPRFGLAVALAPVDLRHFPVSAFWHRRNQNAPLTGWVLRQLQDAVREKEKA